MTSITTADQLALERDYTKWTNAQPVEKLPVLARASDYILGRYYLRSDLTETETARVDLATFLIANDLLANPDTLALRASQPVKKTNKELKGMVTSTEYFEAPADPYPQITAMLAPLLVTDAVSTGGGFYSGRQRV